MKTFEGMFLVFRRSGNKLKRRYAGNPRFRHKTLIEAQTEAERLLTLYPESSFVIIQEVGVIKNS